jgi:hypothetical protein
VTSATVFGTNRASVILSPGVRSAYLDTGRGGGVSADVAILSLWGWYRNGTEGWDRVRKGWPVASQRAPCLPSGRGRQRFARRPIAWKGKQEPHPLLCFRSDFTPLESTARRINRSCKLLRRSALASFASGSRLVCQGQVKPWHELGGIPAPGRNRGAKLHNEPAFI